MAVVARHASGCPECPSYARVSVLVFVRGDLCAACIRQVVVLKPGCMGSQQEGVTPLQLAVDRRLHSAVRRRRSAIAVAVFVELGVFKSWPRTL